MDLKLLPTVISRTPLFSYEDTLEDKWDELKEAIKISSKDLYEQIKDTRKEDYDQLPEKVRFSCWKYFNRARFRATPFGPFGSITMVPLEREGSEVIVEKDPTLHTFTNWIHKDTLLSDLPNLYKNAKFFQANTSVYPCGDQLRYISTLEDGTFEIASIDKQAIIEDVLQLCKTTIAKEKIVKHLISKYELELAVVDDFLIQLIELQLLLTDLHPNIIGTDYFKRVGLDGQEFKENPYIIATRSLLKGSLSTQQFKVIPEAINFIKDYLPQPVHKPLEDFKRAFQLKFEYREVPLLEALDPELGVGYNELESSPHTDELIELLKGSRIQENEQIPYTPFHQFLLNGILKGEDIQLEELVKHDLPKYVAKFPNTFSAVVKMADDQLILEQTGGCTANSLLGRFTLDNPNLITYCKALVKSEENANPDIIFFDIAYQSEIDVDNINRRETIYKYQLSILSWTDQNLLGLDDIMISVQNEELVLRSKQYNKRLIPRLTSAYNHIRSDLSIYRFLCDIQHQGLQTLFNIKLPFIFPNLNFYPRITYKNIIFTPRTWKISAALFAKNDKLSAIEILKNWLKEKTITEYFGYGERDQFVIFNQNNLNDLSHLLQQLRRKKDIYIYEVLLPSSSSIKNIDRQNYLSEIIVNLHNSNNIYSTIREKSPMLERKVDPFSLPGQDWVYFEIYIHHTSANTFLISNINDYIKKIKPKIKRWFFIRYSVPSYHIRLRIQLKNPDFFQEVTTNLFTILKPCLRTGLVNNLQIKPYCREIERYGANTIEQVEKYFGKDSEYVLSLIGIMIDFKDFYLLVIRLLDDIFFQLNIVESQRLKSVESIANHLAQKYDLTGHKFKKINSLWKELMQYPQLHLPKRLESKYKGILLEANSLLSIFDHQRRLQVMGDLLHMHINRLFTTDQNIHELIIYQLYYKVVKSRLQNPTQLG